MVGIELDGRLVGESLREFIEIDMIDGEIIWNNFMQIRVKLDVADHWFIRRRLGLEILMRSRFGYLMRSCLSFFTIVASSIMGTQM